MKEIAERQWLAAMDLNLSNIFDALRRVAPKTRLLDLGCDSGHWTVKFAEAVEAASMSGVELHREHAVAAAARGVHVTVTDLNDPLPFRDGTFDVVVSNQVIEHLADTDQFVAEILRVLAPGGVAVTSTENLASWHNIGPLLFGWQPFSLTNVTSTGAGLGNPLALHRNDEQAAHRLSEHRRVFSYRALQELFTAHGFSHTDLLGAGYFPLPAGVGRLHPRHAAFLTVLASKPRPDGTAE